MAPEMAAWIAEHVKDQRRMCAYWTECMQSAFPQLRRVRGHYYEPNGDCYTHWWLAMPNGEIVDPTVTQFEAGGHYVEYSGSDPYGQCLECGELMWERWEGAAEFCSQECHDAFMVDFDAERRRA